MRRYVTFLLLWMINTGPVAAQQAVGEQFQVNQETSGFQRSAEVAVADDGSFVAVWQSGDEAGSLLDDKIRAQRFGNNGAPVGPELEVNDLTNVRQVEASVASDPQGHFIVVWTSEGSPASDNDFTSIQGRRFTSDGTPLGSQFQVNTHTLGDQSYPNLDVDADGSFIVSWTSENYQIRVSRFDSNGVAIGDEIIASEHADTKYSSKVAWTSDGGFVIAWTDHFSLGSDNSDAVALARRFGPDGEPLGGEFQVNTTILGWQGDPNLAVATDDSFVILFSSDPYTTQGSDAHLYGQRFAADGTPLGEEFQVETETGDFEVEPSVIPLPGGGFFVAWGTYAYPDIFHNTVRGQLFDAAGNKVGGPSEIPTLAQGNEWRPHAAVNALGDFVVVWTSEGSSGTDTSETSVQGQRFTLTLFQDDFETGDLSAWSSVSP